MWSNLYRLFRPYSVCCRYILYELPECKSLLGASAIFIYWFVIFRSVLGDGWAVEGQPFLRRPNCTQASYQVNENWTKKNGYYDITMIMIIITIIMFIIILYIFKMLVIFMSHAFPHSITQSLTHWLIYWLIIHSLNVNLSMSSSLDILCYTSMGPSNLSDLIFVCFFSQGDEYVLKYDRSSLRKLGCVGEPLNQVAQLILISAD